MLQKFKKNILIITYTSLTLFLFQINFFTAKSYSRATAQYNIGDCVSLGRATFIKIIDITDENYYVFKCFYKTAFLPPHCNENEWEIPIAEFERELYNDYYEASLNDCPSGLRIASF